MGAQSCNFYNFGSHFLQFLSYLLAQVHSFDADKRPCYLSFPSTYSLSKNTLEHSHLGLTTELKRYIDRREWTVSSMLFPGTEWVQSKAGRCEQKVSCAQRSHWCALGALYQAVKQNVCGRVSIFSCAFFVVHSLAWTWPGSWLGLRFCEIEIVIVSQLAKKVLFLFP